MIWPIALLLGGLLALTAGEEKGKELETPIPPTPEPKIEPPAPTVHERVIERIYVAPEPRKRRRHKRSVATPVEPVTPPPAPQVELEPVPEPAGA